MALENDEFVLHIQCTMESQPYGRHHIGRGQQHLSLHPNQTFGYNLSSYTGGQFHSLVVADSAPVICDQTLQLAGVTIEIQPFETPHWISQNLHSAAMMLRQLRSRWRPQWRYIWLQ